MGTAVEALPSLSCGTLICTGLHCVAYEYNRKGLGGWLLLGALCALTGLADVFVLSQGLSHLFALAQSQSALLQVVQHQSWYMYVGIQLMSAIKERSAMQMLILQQSRCNCHTVVKGIISNLQ